MPDTVWDAEVQSTLDQAFQPGVKLVIEYPAGSIEVTEIDGGITNGPLHVMSINLRPVEI